MKTWMVMLLLACTLASASCGISGGSNGPDDTSKAELEIRNVTVTPTDTSATVHWSTTRQTVGTLACGRTRTDLTNTKSSDLASEHSIELLPLESDTEYWFQITATSPTGPRAMSQPASFRTLVSSDIADSTAPVISDIQVVGITASSATVTWTTDDRTRGTVYYSETAAWLSRTEPAEAGYVRTHALTLTNLTEGALYRFWISAANRPGRSSQSPEGTFQTTEPPTIEIAPDTLRVTGDTDFTFRVTLRNAANIGGITFTMGYDPRVMEIVSVREGGFWTDNDGVLFLKESEDATAGRIEYGASWKVVYQNGQPVGTLANGGGEVALITARTKGQGTSGRVFFVVNDEDVDGKADTRLFDYNREELRFNIRDGWVVRGSR